MESPSWEASREAVLDMASFVCADIKCAALVLGLVGTTLYRIPNVFRILQGYRRHRARWSSPCYASLRASLYRDLEAEAFEVMADIPVIAVATASLPVGVWRAPLLCRQLYMAESAAARRALVYAHAALVLEECPYLVLAVVTSLMGFWRAPALATQIWQATQRGERSEAICTHIWRHACEVCRDLPALGLGLMASLAVWRLPGLCHTLYEANAPGQWRSIVRERAPFGLLDPAAFASVFVVMLSLWRAVPLWRSSAAMRHDASLWQSNFELHKIIFAEAAQLILELPFIVLQVCPLWRVVGMWSSLQRAKTNAERRQACLTHVILAPADLLAAAAGLMVTVTLWNTREMWAQLHQEVGRPHGANPFRFHSTVFWAWLSLICDLPYIACLGVSCLAPWRIPAMIQLVHELREASLARKLKASSELAVSALLDLPSAILLGLLCLTWRSHAARHIAARLRRGGEFHLSTWRLGLEVLFDVPFILAVPLMLWRLPFFTLRFYANAEERCRTLVARSVLHTACDFLAMAAYTVSALIPWNTLPTLGTAFGALLESLSDDTDASSPAQVRLSSVKIVLPTDTDNHGICFELQGQKPASLRFDSASLHLEGHIWDLLVSKVGHTAVSAAKFAIHPVSLCPSFLDASTVAEGNEEFAIRVEAACGYRGSKIRLSHARLHSEVDRLLAVEDCPVGIRVSYKGGPAACPLVPPKGVLCRFRFKLSDIRAQCLFEGDRIDLAEDLMVESPPRDQPCPFHTTALATLLQAAANLPKELFAFMVALLPMWVRSPRLLSLLFRVGPSKVPDEERGPALESTAIAQLHDVLGALCFMVASLVPWRIHRNLGLAATSLVAASTGKGDEFWCAGRVAFQGLWVVPMEALALTICSLPPWGHTWPLWKRVLAPEQGFSELENCEAAIRHRRFLFHHAKKALRETAASLMSLCLVVTIWRIPALASSLWSSFKSSVGRREHWRDAGEEDEEEWESSQDQDHDRDQDRSFYLSARSMVLQVVEAQFCGLVLDFRTILQASFICLTVIGVPDLCSRLVIFASRYAGDVNRQGSLLWRLWTRRHRDNEPAGASPLLQVAPVVLREGILPYLRHQDLCHLAGSNARLRQMTKEDELWEALWKQEFADELLPASGTLQMKERFASMHLSRAPDKPVLDDEYEEGLVYVVDQAFWNISFEELLCLPLQLCGLLSYPIHELLMARFQAVPSEWNRVTHAPIRSLVLTSEELLWKPTELAQDADFPIDLWLRGGSRPINRIGERRRAQPWAQGGQWAYRTRSWGWWLEYWCCWSMGRCPSVLRFDNLHCFFVQNVLNLFQTVWHDLSLLLALVNTALFALCAHGWPLMLFFLGDMSLWGMVSSAIATGLVAFWLRQLGADRIFTVIFAGLFLPVFGLLQLYLLWGPFSQDGQGFFDNLQAVIEAAEGHVSWLGSHPHVVATQGYLGASLWGSIKAGAGLTEAYLLPFAEYLIPFLRPLSQSFVGTAMGGAENIASRASHLVPNFGLHLFSIRTLFPLLQVKMGLLQPLLELMIQPLELALDAQVFLLQKANQRLQVGYWGHWVLDTALGLLFSHWVLRCMWLFVVTTGMAMTTRLVAHCFPELDPLELYTLPLQLARRLLRYLWRVAAWCTELVWTGFELYGEALAFCTRVCCVLGFMGDVALTPIALLWMGWPLRVPFYLAQQSLLVTAVPFSLCLCVAGMRIIKANWGKPRR